MLPIACLALQATATLTLDLSKPGVAVSPTLYGLMTEEINFSYEGGLYGELVRNRTFKDNSDRALHWRPVGTGSAIALDHKEGVSAALPVSLNVRGGVANEGYWGIPVHPGTTYRLTLWAKAGAPGPIGASIESADGETVFARAEIAGVGDKWRKFTTTLTTSKGTNPTKDARLVLQTGRDRETWLGSVSLLPPTFGGRPNGNRMDLMRMLVDMRPKFLRFPGGNYVEGNSFAQRYAWKTTIGPIEDRPGHMSPWGYRSTDGLGLLEFLNWCEDMHAKPVLAVFAGYVLGGQVVKAGPELQPYVQEALDEIEYVTGGPDSKWGAQRIKDGHAKPFPLECVEIGNEDGFDRSGSYEGRFVQFYDAIKGKYPALRVISTTGGKDWLGPRYPIKQRSPDLFDEHYYASNWDMMAMATKYDGYDRKGPKIFVGEWASQNVDQPWTNAAQKGPTSDLSSAISDAAFMTGLERNSDMVVMSCYAPLLVNVNPGARQWATNLIGYDTLSSFGSPSYYAQKMFSTFLGDRTVPIALSDVPTQTQGAKSLPALFASVTRDSRRGVIYLKVVNAQPTSQDLKIDISGRSIDRQGTEVVLTGDPKSVNSPAEPAKVTPATTKVDGLGPSFHLSLSPTSVTVLQMSEKR